MKFSDVNKMNQDDILQSTKSVIQSLDTLKNQHKKILEILVNPSENVSSNKIEEKLDLGLLKIKILNSFLFLFLFFST